MHPGRAVNTLFTFLLELECWDEPKAAFLRQRPDPAPPPLGQASSAENLGPSLRGHPLVAGAVMASLGSPQFAVWSMDHHLPSTGSIQITDTVTLFYNSILLFATSTSSNVLVPASHFPPLTSSRRNHHPVCHLPVDSFKAR